jgi:hypothetical protein
MMNPIGTQAYKMKNAGEIFIFNFRNLPMTEQTYGNYF